MKKPLFTFKNLKSKLNHQEDGKRKIENAFDSFEIFKKLII